jgi:hypothetical protein
MGPLPHPQDEQGSGGEAEEEEEEEDPELVSERRHYFEVRESFVLYSVTERHIPRRLSQHLARLPPELRARVPRSAENRPREVEQAIRINQGFLDAVILEQDEASRFSGAVCSLAIPTIYTGALIYILLAPVRFLILKPQSSSATWRKCEKLLGPFRGAHLWLLIMPARFAAHFIRLSVTGLLRVNRFV